MKKYLLLMILLFACAIPSFSQTSDWFTDISAAAGLSTADGSRVFCADLNGDNYPDYIVTGSSAIRNTLKVFLNLPDPQNPGKRKYVDFTEESGINVNSDPTKATRSSDVVGLADFDNDGDLDVMTATYTHRITSFADSNGIEQGNYSEVLLNDGHAHFTLVKNSGTHDIIAYKGKVTLNINGKPMTFDYPPYFLNATGMSFLDYDMDGNIDVYISTWFTDYDPNTPNEIKMKDVLLKGNGDGTFTQIFDPAINSVQEPMYGVNVTDYNNDGWPDVVTSAYCRSGGSLFKNMKNGKFTDASKEANYSGQLMAGDHGQALCQWEAIPGDFDNDGDMDLLQVSVHGGCDPGEGRTHISVNNGPDSNYSYRWDLSLLKRNVPASYTHVGDMGGEWIDLDGDGFLDVVVCQQGYESGDINTSGQTRTYMLLQNAQHSFDEITDKLGMMISANRPHSVEPCDYDLDGDPDLMITREVRTDPAVSGIMKTTLWQNNNIPGSFWSSVKVNAAKGCNKAAIGARITMYSNGMAQIRELASGLGHFGGFQPLIKNFGMGKCHAIDSIKVRFPNKELKTVTVKYPPTNAFLIIGENGLEGMLFPDQKQYSVIGFDQSYLNYDLVSYGNSKSMKFNVKNFGTAELKVTKITMLDNDKNVYSFTNPIEPFNLQPNESKEIEVKFTPSERTKFISTISFESNAYNAKAGLFELRGDCFKEEPMIAGDMDTLRMGTVLNDDFVEKSVEVRNYGELDLNIASAEISSADKSFFTIVTDCANLILKAGEKKDITVKFAPAVTTDRAVPAELILHCNAYNSSNFAIPIKVRGEIRKAYAEVITDNGALVFPDTKVGCSCEEPLLINSIGNKPLEITSFQVKFDNAGVFGIRDYKPPYVVDPGKSISLPFTFTPNKEQSWSRSLILTTNDYKTPQITLSIQGRGLKGDAVMGSILNSSITAFPQPANENVLVSIHFDELMMTTADISLYNSLGQEVKAILKPVNSTKELAFELELSNLPSGFYNLVVKVAGATYEKPIIISK